MPSDDDLVFRFWRQIRQRFSLKELNSARLVAVAHQAGWIVVKTNLALEGLYTESEIQTLLRTHSSVLLFGSQGEQLGRNITDEVLFEFRRRNPEITTHEQGQPPKNDPLPAGAAGGSGSSNRAEELPHQPGAVGPDGVPPGQHPGQAGPPGPKPPKPSKPAPQAGLFGPPGPYGA